MKLRFALCKIMFIFFAAVGLSVATIAQAQNTCPPDTICIPKDNTNNQKKDEPAPGPPKPGPGPTLPQSGAETQHRGVIVLPPASSSAPSEVPAGSGGGSTPNAGAPPNVGTPRPNVAERAGERKSGLGFENFRRWLTGLEKDVKSGQGVGAAHVDRYFDQQRRTPQSFDPSRSGKEQPQRGGPFSSPTITPVDKSPTRQSAGTVVKTYGSTGGGIVLEGAARGLGPISRIQYHAALNALMLDDRAAYFFPIPAGNVAVLCRALQADDRVGVSLGKVHIRYGVAPPDSDMITDLKMADHFLGDIVWAGKDWTASYRFAGGYEPERLQGPGFPLLVHFNFGNYQFAIVDEEIRLTNVTFSAELVPVSKNRAPDGGFLPDLEAIDQGLKIPEYERNKSHVVNNIDYYRKERIVKLAFEYGEVAAFLRGLKAEGVDLDALAATISTGSGAQDTSAPSDGDPNARMEREWASYLKQIQEHNDYVNWSGPPYDLYVKRLTEARSHEEQTYRVVGVAANDALNIRSGPSADQQILSRIPPNGRGIRIVGACAGQWCQIDFRGARGWVNKTYLQLEQEPSTTTYRVVRVAANDVLNIRLGPGARHPLTGWVPPDGRDVRLVNGVECVGVWCEIDFQGTRGWVNTLFLTPEPAAEAAAATYRVIGVAANDVLNIRSAPNAESSIVQTIPPNGRGVHLVGDCTGQWCQVDYRGARGWVNRTFLTPEQ